MYVTAINKKMSFGTRYRNSRLKYSGIYIYVCVCVSVCVSVCVCVCVCVCVLCIFLI